MPQATNAAWSFAIRPAGSADAEFILTLSHRLDDGGLPPWHDPAAFHAFHQGRIEQVAAIVAAVPPDQAVLIAEMSPDQEHRIPLGLVSVRDDANRFTGERQGHIQALAVTAEAAGQGVARALLIAAEAWARGRGHRLIALGTAGVNARSRAFYRGGEYQEEAVTLVKVL